MSRSITEKRRKGTGVKRIFCLLVTVLLCGCKEQEITKTVILPDTVTKKSTGIDVKNIQEYTCEEEVIDMTWSREGAGRLCLIRNVDGKYVYQTADVYQKTVSEEEIFAESLSDFVKIAPGGRFTAFGTLTDDVRRLFVYDADRKESELLMEWEGGVNVGNFAWSGDGMRFFIWMVLAEVVQDQVVSEESSMYCFDMESEERMKSEMKLSVNDVIGETMLPNEDGSRVFARKEHFDSRDRQEENLDVDAYIEEREKQGKDYLVTQEKKDWIFDMETGETEEIDLTRLSLQDPVKYTEAGLFGTEGDKLWLVREPLKEASGKRLLDEECVDLCICEKGDHIFLIGREEQTDYLQVTGILLEDGEIQEYQVLYKGIYGEYGQSFIGMDDHELVIQSFGVEENNRWTLKATILDY